MYAGMYATSLYGPVLSGCCISNQASKQTRTYGGHGNCLLEKAEERGIVEGEAS